MTAKVREFEPSDAQAIALIYRDYLTELFNATSSPLSADVILREGQGKHFRIVLATDNANQPVGFAFWRESYDFHNAVSGGEVPELFVAKPHRGRVLSLKMLAFIARKVMETGGKYLMAPVLMDNQKRTKLVRRMAVGFPLEHVYLSGRGMRMLASLTEVGAKEFVRRLPTPAMSREP